MKLRKLLRRGTCLLLVLLMIAGTSVLQKGDGTMVEAQTPAEQSLDLNGTWNFWPDLAGESTVVTVGNDNTASVQATLSANPITQVLSIADPSVVQYGKISVLIEIAMNAFDASSEVPLLFVSVNENTAASVSLEGKDVGRKIWVDLPLNPAQLRSGNNTITFTATPADTVKVYGNSDDAFCVTIEYFHSTGAVWQDMAVPGVWEGNFELKKQKPVTGNTSALGITINQTNGLLVDLTPYSGQTKTAIEIPLSLSQLKTGGNTFRFSSNTVGGAEICYYTPIEGSDISGSGTYANDGYSPCGTDVPGVTLQLKNRDGSWVTVAEHTETFVGNVCCGVFSGNNANYSSQSTLAVDDLSLYTEAKLTVIANVAAQSSVFTAAEGLIPSTAVKGMVPAICMVTNDKDYTLINARQYAGLGQVPIQIPINVSSLRAGKNTFRLGSNVTAFNGQNNGTSVDIYYYTTASGADVTGSGTWDENNFSQGSTNIPAATLHLQKPDGTWESLSGYTDPMVGSVVTGIFSANNHNYQSQAAFTVTEPSAYTQAYISVLGHVGLLVSANANAEELIPHKEVAPYLQLTVNGAKENDFDLTPYAGGVNMVEVPLTFEALKEGKNVLVFDSNVNNKGQGQGNFASVDLVISTPKTVPDKGTGYWENYTFKQLTANEDFYVSLYLQRKDNDEWVPVYTHNADNAGKNILVGLFSVNNASYRPQVTLAVENLSDYKAAKLQALMNVGNSLECFATGDTSFDYDTAQLNTADNGEPFLRVGVNTTEQWTIQGLAPYAGTTSDVMIPVPISSLVAGNNQFYFHSNVLNGGNCNDGTVDLMSEDDTEYKNSAYSQDGLKTYQDMGEEGLRFQVFLALKRKDNGKWEEVGIYNSTSSKSLVVGRFTVNGNTFVPRVTLPVENPDLYSQAVLTAKLHVGESTQVVDSDSLSYDGVGWYNRTVTLPPKQKGTEQLLHFEAVDYLAEIFINGVFVGSHEGGYAPFDVSLEAAGDAVNYGGTNIVTVRVTDQSTDVIVGKIPIKETPAGFLQDTIAINYGGIWGEVSLITRSTVYADHLYIDTDIENGTAAFHATVYNPGDSQLTVAVTADVLQKQTGGSNGTANTAVTLRAGESKEINIPVTLTECTLWEIDNPHLYTAKLTLSENGSVAQTVTQDFGMRRIERDGKQLLFNNKGIFLTGWITWEVKWDTVAPLPTEEEVRKQITDLKNYGFNAIKYCLVVPPDYVLDICDEMGIYVYIEYPIWEPNTSEAFFTRCYQQIPELIEKDRNHPSVILSDFACELVSYTEDMDSLLKHLVEAGKKIDPNRLYTENSTVHVNKYGDFRTFHPYTSLTDFDRYVDHWAEYRGNYPVILGEYADSRTLSRYQDIVEVCGGEEPWWWKATNPPPNTYAVLKNLGFTQEQIETFQDASYASSQEAKRGYIEAAKSNPYVSGLFLTQLVDIKHNTCGFYDELGNLKYDSNELKGSAGATALLIDDQVNQKRNFTAGKEAVIVPAVSHFNGKNIENGILTYSLSDGDTEILSGTIQKSINLKNGNYFIFDKLAITMPEVSEAKKCMLTFTLACDAFTVDNHWDIWIYPDEMLRSSNKTVACYDPESLYEFQGRYPWMTKWRDGSTPDAVITTKMTDGLTAYLNAGGKVIYLGGGTGPVAGSSDTDGFTNFTSSSLIFFPDETHPLVKALASNGYGGAQFIPLTSPLVQPYKAGRISGKVIYGRICHGGETYSYLSEYTVGSGTLLQCSLRLHEKQTPQLAAGDNPLGCYMVDQMLRYTLDEFEEAPLTELLVTPPAKIDYAIGDDLDLTGMTVKAQDANGIQYAVLENKLTVSGYNADAVGQQTITITYEGLTATFVVTVVDPGDVNDDGDITAADALLALQAAVKKITLDETKTRVADVNHDGSITAADALLILQYAVKKIDSFPTPYAE